MHQSFRQFLCFPPILRFKITALFIDLSKEYPEKYNLSLIAMEQSKLFKVVEIKQDRKIYQIEPILIPYVFNFSSTVLRSCILSDQLKTTNPVALEMFQYLKQKILPKRKYSKSGRMPTRMKAEEKIKFVMRCLENNLARIYNRPAAKLVNFNLQQQKTFFRRGDVRQHFLVEVPRIIQEKQKQNLQKIKEMEGIIMTILNEAKVSQKQAKRMLQRDIKQKQLPWSIDMFTDIEQFCKDIYRDFIKNSHKHQQSSIQVKQKAKFSIEHDDLLFNQVTFDGDPQLQEEEKTEQKKIEQTDINECDSTKNSSKSNDFLKK